MGEAGTLEIGHNLFISANSCIVCFKSVIFGSDVTISWEAFIIDVDFHKIDDSNPANISEIFCKPIHIGNNSWIGMRTTILKGTVIPPFTTVGASSLLNKHYMIPEYSILAGNPAILKTKKTLL